MRAKSGLVAMSAQFEKMIHDHKLTIMAGYDVVVQEIQTFERELDITKAPNNLLVAKKIEDQLNELMEESLNLNKQREFMKFN